MYKVRYVLLALIALSISACGGNVTEIVIGYSCNKGYINTATNCSNGNSYPN